MRPEDSAADRRYGRSVRRAAVLVIVSLGLIFGLYQIVEHLWLRHASMGVLHTLHIVRGLLAAGVAAWLVGRSFRLSPPALLAPETARDETGAPSESERTTHFARWFIQMRWTVVVGVFALTLFAVKILRFLPEKVWWPLVATDALVGASNVAYILILRRKKLRYLLLAQALTDLAFLHALLHFSGGIENPFAFLALMHVIIAGIILRPHRCYLVVAAATLLFAALAFAEYGRLLAHYTLRVFPHAEGEEIHAAHQILYVGTRIGLHAVIVALVAYFVTALAQWGRRQEEAVGRMTERALRDHQLMEQALETTGTALCVVDRGMKSCWVNARWKEWFAAGGLGGSLPQRLVEGERAPVLQVLRDGAVRVVEIEGSALAEMLRQADPRRKDGAIQFTVGPIRDGGTVEQVVVLAQDVSERKRAHSQLMKAGKLAAVGELAGHVAHEVNNPIAVISGKARLLLSDHRREMSEKVAGEIVKIVDLSHRVAKIAQGLLQYCRPSIGARTKLDLTVPVRRALALIEQRAKSCGVRVVDGLGQTRSQVVASSNELEQVFLNLFINALDAMPQGGVLRVAPADARLADGTPAVGIRAEDSGIGIASEVRERLFEPFFTTKGEGKGTGLGLAICLGVVRAHGGEIDVESTVGKGSCFTIKLPAGGRA